MTGFVSSTSSSLRFDVMPRAKICRIMANIRMPLRISTTYVSAAMTVPGPIMADCTSKEPM